jgi:hypothetical protein
MSKIKMECTIKKWGNSVGIILPKDVVKELDLKPHDKINIEVEKGVKGREIFGLFPDWKINTQKVKDDSREDWG